MCGGGTPGAMYIPVGGGIMYCGGWCGPPGLGDSGLVGVSGPGGAM